MKKRISEEIIGVRIQAIWEILIGFIMFSVPFVIALLMIDNSRFILFGFSLIVSIIVIAKQIVLWNICEVSIDDEAIHVKRFKHKEQIEFENIKSIKHYLVHRRLRERHIKITFERKTKFGKRIFFDPIDVNKGSIWVDNTILEFLNQKIKDKN